MRDPHFLSRRRNGDGERPWRGPREPEEVEETPGGWWALASRIVGAPASEPAQRDPASMSKRQLYQEAKRAGITGRSSMNKQQLAEALRNHRASASAPEPPPRTRPAGRQTDSRKAERCAIVPSVSGDNVEFQVVPGAGDGSRAPIARSPAFPAPSGELRRKGAARDAHELLVKRLFVAGWWPAEGGSWPETQFVRVRPPADAGGRVLVTVVRDAVRARFVAEKLDGYGNPTTLMESDPFRAPRPLPVRGSRQARAALAELVERLGVDGWTVAQHVGDEWYSLSLWRGRSRRRRP